MKYFVLLFVLCAILNSKKQSQQTIFETDRFLYWQNGTEINFDDFTLPIDSSGIKLCEKYGTNSLANIQIHSILDYPKNKRSLKTLDPKIYFAPSFCKDCSLLLQRDSSELKLAQLYFDIAEYCVRLTRKNIIQLENNGKGLAAAAFPRIVDEMYKLMGEMFGAVVTQVLIDKKPEAYKKWRKDCDNLLNETKGFATTQTDCLRFINKKPYSDKYFESYAVYGKE
jgi:hypothetical protein